ncbi:MAG: glycosyltransferase [Bacteroidota bacterium]
MVDKEIHIVSFNVPYPPNYGGVIDVFYKIKALANAGVKIHLHTFQYGRPKSEKLEEYCEKVYYYDRRISLGGIFSKMPIIVSSRSNERLLNLLIGYDFPILFEGLHTTRYINHPDLKGRQLIVRTHNVEWQYYKHLATLEKKWYKRLYFNIEAKRLKQYERFLTNASEFICISNDDQKYYEELFPGKTIFIPAFHENDKLQIEPGNGEYVLYHGDLSVKDNEAAALFLINEVFKSTPIKLIIAGLNPGQILKDRVRHFDHISLTPNPGFKEMRSLIANAHVNLLYSFQSAGMKLKLLNALFLGRHCVVNSKMVQNSEMERLCIVADSGLEIAEALKRIVDQPFGQEEIAKRENLLIDRFSNQNNGQLLTSIIR